MAKATVTEKVTTTKVYHLELAEEEAQALYRAVNNDDLVKPVKVAQAIYDALAEKGLVEV